jgi:hypothetical protein
MALKEHVLGLLRGPEASRIRFTAPTTTGPITINRATFATVASAIDAGKIGVTPFTPTKLAGAKYFQPAGPGAPPSGQLHVPPILGRIHEGEVMHECTHAFFDLKKTAIGARDEEAVCYVVSALYYRMTGLTPARWTGAEPYITAKSVVDALLHQYAVGVAGIPVVNAGAFRTLVIAVQLSPTYLIPDPDSPMSGTPAGLFGGFFGGPTSYTHDG